MEIGKKGAARWLVGYYPIIEHICLVNRLVAYGVGRKSSIGCWLAPNLGRIITTAKSDHDADGSIADGTAVTYYQCFEYGATLGTNKNLVTKVFAGSTTFDCKRTSGGPYTLYSYTANQLTSLTRDPDGANLTTLHSSTLDTFGNPVSITDPNGIPTYLEYDPRGRTLSSTIASHATEYQYLGDDLARVTYPKDDYMSYIYGSTLHGLSLHKLAKAEHRNSSDDLIEQIVYGYTVVNNTRQTTEQIKDGSGNLTMEKITVEGYGAYDGETLRYVQVTEGNTQVGGDSKVVVKTWYNAQNQPFARVEDPGGEDLLTTYLYDDEGRLIEVENALLDRTTYKYDEWGNLVGTTVDPDTLHIETLYVYDNFGRLIRTDSPDANSTVYVYNADGTLAMKKEGCATDGSGCEQTTEYEYDGLGRLVRTDYNQTENLMEEFYVYDGELSFTPWEGQTPEDWEVTLAGGTLGEGRLTATLLRGYIDGDTTMFIANNYSYDAEGRVIGKHYQTHLHQKNESDYNEITYNPYNYEYDPNGALQQISYFNGRYVYYCLDGTTDPTRPRAIRTGTAAMDDCTDGTAVASGITYYPFGDIKQMTLANGQVQNFARDKRYALQELKDGTSGDDDAYHKIAYTYDDFGNITGIDDQSVAQGQYADHTLSYDELHQLSGATLSIHDGHTNATTYRETFAYNAAGNRTAYLHGAVTRTFEYTSGTNILADIKHGNTVREWYDYNDLGRLTLITEDLGDGTTQYVTAQYAPPGFMMVKEDYVKDAGVVTMGDTVAAWTMPNGERAGKVNLGLVTDWVYAYDPAGNLLHEGSKTDYGDPVIQHIYLGNRIIASITGTGDACFIATVAYGSPLAKDLDVFRAFRDRILNRITAGQGLIRWYYKHGPAGAKWLEGHGAARAATYYTLAAVAIPLKAFMFGHWILWPILLTLCLCVFVVGKKLGWRRSTAIITSAALAFSTVIVYSFLVEVPVAQADYSPIDTVYYTVDHIGRPFNARDNNDLRWYEQHYSFGEVITEGKGDDPEDPPPDLTAGAGDNVIIWQPHFRFPGQFDDSDQYPFVQNHYREYLPELGRYNRVDPLKHQSILLTFVTININPFIYAYNKPYLVRDFLGKCGTYDYYIWSYDEFWIVFDAGGYDPSMSPFAFCKILHGYCDGDCIISGEEWENEGGSDLYPLRITCIYSNKSPECDKFCRRSQPETSIAVSRR